MPGPDFLTLYDDILRRLEHLVHVGERERRHGDARYVAGKLSELRHYRTLLGAREAQVFASVHGESTTPRLSAVPQGR